MSNNVLYIVGAGFSRPFNLPLMSDFLERSKDIYYSNNHNNRYKHFNEIYRTIKDFSSGLSFMNYDLNNIEDILSLIDMMYYTNTPKSYRKMKLIIKFISDVINYYTPKLKDHLPKVEYLFNPGNTIGYKSNHLFYLYSSFILNILNAKLTFNKFNERNIEHSLVNFSTFDSDYKYGMISLNYDLIIEDYISYFNDKCNNKNNYSINTKPCERPYEIEGGISLAKLHGSLAENSVPIVPPTWAGKIDSKLRDTWSLGRKLIEQANYIRFVGYSLPESDYYMKYLLSTGISNTTNLKKISACCIDNSGTIKGRYEKLFKYKFQFYNQDFTTLIDKKISPSLGNEPVNFINIPSSYIKNGQLYCFMFDKLH